MQAYSQAVSHSPSLTRLFTTRLLVLMWVVECGGTGGAAFRRTQALGRTTIYTAIHCFLLLIMGLQDYEKAAELGADDEGSSEQVAQLLRDAKAALKKSKRIDYYALLEIDQSASEVDIKKGFRRACLKWHPDKVSNQ